MKKAIISLFLLISLIACNSAPKQATGNFGAKITEQGASNMKTLAANMQGKDQMKTKVQGEIASVCKKKGCWMTLKKDDGESMRVTFKDYGFFVPLDCEGKTAIIEGVAKFDTTSVETLRHFAEDEGLSAQEIAKITKPEVELVFVADGAIVK